MIVGKEGRARFTTSDRAIVLVPTHWRRGEDELMEGLLLKRTRTPADLVKACETAGATVRPTSSGGAFVRGPTGSATIPCKWDQGRCKANTIAAVRRLGLDFESALAPKPKSPTEIPELSIVDQPEEIAVTSPAARPNPLTSIPSRKPSATKEDLEAALELIETLSDRISVLARRLDKAEAQLTELMGGREPSTRDKARIVREQIVEWFRTLPPGFRATASVVTSNLVPDADKPTRDSYTRQLYQLVEAGELRAEKRVGGPGRGGAPTHYCLPEPDGAPL